MHHSSTKIAGFFSFAALSLLLAIALGWLFRFWPHLYLVVLVLTIFGAIPLLVLKHRGTARLAGVVLLVGVLGGGFAGMFWDNLLAVTAAA